MDVIGLDHHWAGRKISDPLSTMMTYKGCHEYRTNQESARQLYMSMARFLLCGALIAVLYFFIDGVPKLETNPDEGTEKVVYGGLLTALIVEFSLIHYVCRYRKLKSLNETDNSESVSFCIHLDRPSGVYYPGESVTGNVVLKCSSHSILCRSLQVGFDSCAFTMLKSYDSPSDQITGSTWSHQDVFVQNGCYGRISCHEKDGEELGSMRLACSHSKARRLNLILRHMGSGRCKGECLLDANALIRSNEPTTYLLTRRGKHVQDKEVTISAELISSSSSAAASGDDHDIEMQSRSYLELKFHSTKGMRSGWFSDFLEVYEAAENTELVQGKALPAPEFKTTFLPGAKIVAPFRFELRDDAPPSAEFKNLPLKNQGANIQPHSLNKSYIRYRIAASMDTPNDQRPSFCFRHITVLANRPLPPPGLLSPYVKEGTVVLLSKSSNSEISDSVTISLELERLAYAPGEVVNLQRTTIHYNGRSTSAFAQVVLKMHFELSVEQKSYPASGCIERPIGEKLPLSPRSHTEVTGEYRIPVLWKDSTEMERAVLPSFVNVEEETCNCIRWTYELGIRIIDMDNDDGTEEDMLVSIPMLITGAPPSKQSMKKRKAVKAVDFGPWDILEHFKFDRMAPFETTPMLRTVDDRVKLVPIGPPERQLDHRESETVHQAMAVSFDTSPSFGD